MFVQDKRLGEPHKPTRLWTTTMKQLLLLGLGVVAFLATIVDIISKDMGYAFISSVCGIVTLAAAFAGSMIAIDMLCELRRKTSR